MGCDTRPLPQTLSFERSFFPFFLCCRFAAGGDIKMRYWGQPWEIALKFGLPPQLKLPGGAFCIFGLCHQTLSLSLFNAFWWKCCNA